MSTSAVIGNVLFFPHDQNGCHFQYHSYPLNDEILSAIASHFKPQHQLLPCHRVHEISLHPCSNSFSDIFLVFARVIEGKVTAHLELIHFMLHLFDNFYITLGCNIGLLEEHCRLISIKVSGYLAADRMELYRREVLRTEDIYHSSAELESSDYAELEDIWK